VDRATWIRLESWYNSLHTIQQWLVKIGLVIFCILFVVIVTHEPNERPRHPKIILNCDHCGTDPERTMTYNEYIDRKEQQQKTWFNEQKQRIQQDMWDERGRQRWCREHPRDYNCKKEQS